MGVSLFLSCRLIIIIFSKFFEFFDDVMKIEIVTLFVYHFFIKFEDRL